MWQASDRRLLFLVLAAAAALAAALALQFFADLPPCPFCVYQRYPYLVVIAVGSLGIWLRRPRSALALAALALAVNIGIAAYHVGIEQGWLALPEGCTPNWRATHGGRVASPARGCASPLRSDRVQFRRSVARGLERRLRRGLAARRRVGTGDPLSS